MGDEQEQQTEAPEDQFSELRNRLGATNAALSRAQERIRRLEHALAQQYDPYQVVFQASYLAEFLVDPDTDTIVDVNPRGCLLYGIPRSKLIEMPFSVASQFAPATLQAITQGIHFSEQQIQLPDGKQHTVEVFSGLLKMSGRSVIHVRISDITERKREEAQVRLLWQALHQSANSVIITDSQGRIEYVNPYFTQLTGYTLDEVRGQNPRILKSGYTTPAEYQTLWSTITAKAEWAGEFSNRKKNGETYWEEARIAPVLDDRGNIAHFIAIKQDITQRKLAEDALAESETRFRSLVNSMNDIVFTLDLEGRCTGFYGQQSEVQIATYLGKKAVEILGPEFTELQERTHQQALQGEPTITEWVVGEQTIQTVLSSQRNSSGEITGFVGLGRDITALKMVERQLRESERFARSTVNALTANIAILDETGEILKVNDAWRTFALKNSGMLQNHCEGANYLQVLEVVPVDDPDAATASAVRRGLQQIIAGEIATFSLEYPYHSPDAQRWFLLKVTRFSGDGPLRIVVAHEPITERVLAEQKLAAYTLNLERLVAERTAQFERLNERLNTILDNISSPVLLLSREGIIINTNPAFNRQMNSQPEEFFGKPLTSLFSQSSHPAVLKALRIAMTGEMPDVQQIQMTDHLGTLIDAELILNPVPNQQEHIICTLHDISHLKEIERIKDEFVSMVSHELRTPVTSLMLSSQILRDYSARLTPQDIQDKVAGMYAQAQHLSKLINSILDISRLEARRGQKGSDPCDIARALHDVITELTEQATIKRHQLDLRIEGAPFNLIGEQLDLERIWRNLLSNAIKYTPDGGHITAHLYGPGQKLPVFPAFTLALPANLTDASYVVGLVEDNGRGMHPDELSTLFTRFNRGWAARSNIPGTGLGLSLVEELLHLYGGDITVASTPGQGSLFCFWIPLD